MGKKKGPSDERTIDNLADQMIANDSYREAFPEKFVISSPENGEYLYYRVIDEKTRLVEPVNKDYICDAIIRFCKEYKALYPELLIHPRLAQDVFKHWRAISEKINGLIKPFEFASGESYVTHRIGFDPDFAADFSWVDPSDENQVEKYPILNFISRCSDPAALLSFIGSIFEMKSFNQQYLYLWGEGSTGKSTLQRLLHKLLDKACHFDSFKSMDSNFWTYEFIGKRLVIFPDSNEASAMQTGLFKQLTGGDLIRCEKKYGAAISVKLNAKFMITSNFAPVLKEDKADLRRTIVIKVDPFEHDIDPTIESKMAEPEQLKFLVDYAIWTYCKNCVVGNAHNPICVKDEQMEFIQNADEDIEEAIGSAFQFGPSEVATFHEVATVLGKKFNHFKIGRILVEKMGCVKLRTRPKNSNSYDAKITYYLGLSRRSWIGEDLNNYNRERERIMNQIKDLDAYKKAHEKLVAGMKNKPADTVAPTPAPIEI